MKESISYRGFVCKMAAGFLIVSTSLCVFGCSDKKSDKKKKAHSEKVDEVMDDIDGIGSSKLSSKNICKAAKKYGAEETDMDTLYVLLTRLPTDQAVYYSSKDADEALQIFNDVINHMGEYDEYDVSEVTVVYVGERTEDDVKDLFEIYYIGFDQQEEADAFCEEAFSRIIGDDGNENGIKYRIYTYDSKYSNAKNAIGVYQSGKGVMTFRIMSNSGDPEFVKFMSDKLGIVNPFDD